MLLNYLSCTLLLSIWSTGEPILLLTCWLRIPLYGIDTKELPFSITLSHCQKILQRVVFHGVCLTVAWALGRKCIQGDDLTDPAAKEASRMHLSTNLPVPLKDARRLVLQKCYELWHSQWITKAIGSCSQFFLHFTLLVQVSVACHDGSKLWSTESVWVTYFWRIRTSAVRSLVSHAFVAARTLFQYYILFKNAGCFNFVIQPPNASTYTVPSRLKDTATSIAVLLYFLRLTSLHRRLQPNQPSSAVLLTTVVVGTYHKKSRKQISKVSFLKFDS